MSNIILATWNGSRINTRTFSYVSIDENDAYTIELEARLIKLITIHFRHPTSSSVKVVMFSSIQHIAKLPSINAAYISFKEWLF